MMACAETKGERNNSRNRDGEQKKRQLCLDRADNISTKRLTRREGFPEEILAAGFALPGSQHGTGGTLHLQARALALRAASHFARVQRFVFGLRELRQQLCERIPGELLRGKMQTFNIHILLN